MFTVQPIPVTTADPAVSARCVDPQQQVFGFVQPSREQYWFAEFIDTESGQVVQSDIFADPYTALWALASILPEDLDLPQTVEYT